jgi:glucose/mannose transport system substrate-binding protein
MLLAAFGCSDSPNTITLEVYSWWDDPEERKAFDSVARMHGQAHENVQVENLRNSSMNARRELSQRMLTDAPPATFQANVGADLLRWAMVDTQDDFEGDVRARPDDTLVLIAELTSFYEEELGGKVPDEVDSMLRLGVQAAPLAVPINIHRLNVLYYNKKNVDAYVDPEGRDLFHIDTLCPETDKPPLAVTIAAPLTDEWTLVLFVFENLLPALIEKERKRDPAFDPDFYDLLFTGKEPGERLPGGESVLVKKALECAKYLSASFSNAGRWPDAVDDVADGTATFTVMGDWANALLKEELRDEIVIPITFPGTEDLYVYTSDTFPLPVGVEYRSEALELLKTFANRDAQVKFSELKGSIPARLDTGFVSPRGWSTTAQFQDPEIRKLLATSGYFPPYYPLRQLWARLRDMLPSTASAAAIDAALREFTNSEKLLGRWQRRLEEGAARTTTMTTPEP